MCGRFSLTDPRRIDRDAFGVATIPAIGPRWNIAPSQSVLLIRDHHGASQAVLARWGLIPSWAKDPAIGNKLANARGETLAEKPSFRSAWRRRRGLVIADGFYEWQPMAGTKVKQPWWITRRDHAPFAFGALWEEWTPPDGPPVLSCTLITTTPNALMAPIHDRMPVLLAPRDYFGWLAATPDPPSHLIAPADPEGWMAVRVSTHVNAPAHDDPDCVTPITPDAMIP